MIGDIQASATLKNSDIVNIQETWLKEENENTALLKMSDYEVKIIKAGKAKGLTTYHNNKFAHMFDKIGSNHYVTKYKIKNM